MDMWYICYPNDMFQQMATDYSIIKLFESNCNDPESYMTGIWITFQGDFYEASKEK